MKYNRAMKRIPTDIGVFRDDLRKAMIANNDTQDGVGRTVGVSQAVICNFLTGKRGLSGDSVFKIMSYVYPEISSLTPDGGADLWPPVQEPDDAA